MKRYFVYVTFENEAQAEKVAESVVEKRLAACANIFSPHKSVYWWDGKVEKATEYAAVFKTTEDALSSLKDHIIEQHSYDVPCVVALPIEAGNAEFLKWIGDEVKV